jgi:hypothetical protein
MSDLDFNMEVSDRKQAEQEISTSSGGGGRSSQYDPIAEKYANLDDGEAILLDGMSQNDIQNLRNLLYRRFGKEEVIVRSKSQGDDTYKAVVRDREGNEYLRDSDTSNGEAPESGDTTEEDEVEDASDEDLDDVF